MLGKVKEWRGGTTSAVQDDIGQGEAQIAHWSVRRGGRHSCNTEKVKGSMDLKL